MIACNSGLTVSGTPSRLSGTRRPLGWVWPSAEPLVVAMVAATVDAIAARRDTPSFAVTLSAPTASMVSERRFPRVEIAYFAAGVSNQNVRAALCR